jgi:twitching motility protein PilT
MDISEKRKPQDGRITIMVDRREYDIRVSVLPTVYGEKVVMRLALKNALTRDKSELGLKPRELEVFNHIISNPNGIILVTGPTGSGKSTTLAGMIDFVNLNRSAHIITVEDPIEYVHEHKRCMVNQREIGDDVPSFSLALRAALREDPDVILVGEMRDFETIQAAVTAAETGHLVMSTLHTTSAADTINRIIDVYPEHQQQQIRTQLANNLVAVISQTLIPRKDGTGRIAVMEILNVTDAIAAMIRDNKIHLIQSAIQTGKQQGMMSLDQELARLTAKGIIGEVDALDKCQDKQEFYRFLTQMGGVPTGGMG